MSFQARLNGWLHEISRSHVLTRWLFLRALGLIYLMAFVSLLTQIDGLWGASGILPAADTMALARSNALHFGNFPTLTWIDASSGFLYGLAFIGALAAVLVIVGVAPLLMLVITYLSYLSFITVGRDFMSFQWDILLTETGFLAILLAPITLRHDLKNEMPPSAVVLLLFRFLLFRLMLGSGVVKLLSGDPYWRTLTALPLHYETQPLPTPLAWYVYQLPQWMQSLSVLILFLIELILPFTFFMPRVLRLVGAGGTAALQVLILLTGNYTFFNFLTIVLCILLLDDGLLYRFFPAHLRVKAEQAAVQSMPRWHTILIVPVAALVLMLGVIRFSSHFTGELPPLAVQLLRASAPFRIVNRYGLFAVMTDHRSEIIIEGSSDGITWFEYEFLYKPGDVTRAPPINQPHQPRLDWQLWFAALADAPASPWFGRFMARLQEGSPEVLALLAVNPFPDEPPRYLRARLYNYRFATPAQRAQGVWWQRQLIGEFYP
jgi:lipase maturation factor 1